MKLIASIVKSFKENIRDWKVLVMVLVLTPFFLLLMYLLYGQSPTTYNIGIVNLNREKASVELIQNIKNMKGSDGSGLFHLHDVAYVDELKSNVKEKTIDVGIVIPEDYSKISSYANVKETGKPAIVDFYGSINNTRYTVAAVLIADIINKHGLAAAQLTSPISISESFLEKKLPLNDFDGYVPGLITLAVLMILFTATSSIVKENDKKTLIRLKLSRLGAFHYLTGICTVQTVIAVIAIVISYWTALALGYRTEGSFGSILFIGVISSLSMVSISLVVASFLNTVFDVLTVGCFPFFILMFFSGSMFPLPKINVLMINGHSLGITDILPLTHTVNSFNKILNYGAGLNDVLFDVVMIVFLTIIYFSAGLILYQKRKLSKA